jgi:hypothetical protein
MHDVVAEVRAYHPPFNPPSAQVRHIRWFFGPYYWDPWVARSAAECWRSRLMSLPALSVSPPV